MIDEFRKSSTRRRREPDQRFHRLMESARVIPWEADAGRGFEKDSARTVRGLGLLSMDERLRIVGGTLNLDSGPKKGTRIEIRIPLGK